MGRMGFLSEPAGDKKKLWESDPQECLLRFDSGNHITFEDARHHMLVMGTTGSGKTASVVLPALFRLIEAGHRGIIVDIKGNLRDQARAFARQCGREADLVEFGSASSATPLNLLSGGLGIITWRESGWSMAVTGRRLIALISPFRTNAVMKCD